MKDVFRGKTVLVTGHTGFKGSWLCIWLHEAGANVVGYALNPRTMADNFVVTQLPDRIHSVIGDIRDYDQLKGAFDQYHPDIVFHLAAQPIVRNSYINPKETYDINIGGTVNVLECCRMTDSVRVVVNVTSDKCYQNNEWVWGYRENDQLGGRDPYSSSKACSELVTAAYRDSFFTRGKCIATARAGNVIGGGDWWAGRIVPDCIKALKRGEPVILRNPDSVRPWQHVLDALSGYLMLASSMLLRGEIYQGAWNFAPASNPAITVRELVERIITRWGHGAWGQGAYTVRPDVSGPHESAMLALDSTKAQQLLGWCPTLSIDEAIQYAVDWYSNPDPDYALCVRQLHDYWEASEKWE